MVGRVVRALTKRARVFMAGFVFAVLCFIVLNAAMMAPDYAWWHGFYELKKRCIVLEEQAEALLQSGKPAKVFKIKSSGGDTTKPDFGR